MDGVGGRSVGCNNNKNREASEMCSSYVGYREIEMDIFKIGRVY